MPSKKAVRPKKKKYNELTPKQRAFAEKWAEVGSGDEAARQTGYSEYSVFDLISHPQVIALKDAILKRSTELASKRVAIDKAFVITRLAELARLSPDDTKGSITGQVNACGELAEILGAKVKLSADLTKQFEGHSDEEMEFFAKHGYWPSNVDTRQSRPN